jgi:hypothetical protein
MKISPEFEHCGLVVERRILPVSGATLEGHMLQFHFSATAVR